MRRFSDEFLEPEERQWLVPNFEGIITSTSQKITFIIIKFSVIGGILLFIYIIYFFLFSFMIFNV